MRTPQSFHIMVTDINQHVRHLLIRELEKDGYTVFSVKSGVMLYEYLCRQTAFDLLILDPELFDACDHGLFRKVLEYKPSRTIILHTYQDIFDGQKTGDNVRLVEKRAESIIALKEMVHACYLQACEEEVSEIFTGCKGG
jgi:hypothetical protein